MHKSYTTDTLDFRINEIPFNELIRHYDRVIFLYPDKKKFIQKFMHLIANNWKKALTANDQLLWIASSHRSGFQKMATISLWRSTNNGWMAQHLTSNAGPKYVKNILIGTQLHAIKNQYHSGQNWFQPKNKYANNIFGSIESNIGKHYANVDSFDYFHVNSNHLIQPINNEISIVQCKNNYYQKTVLQFLMEQMGHVYVKTEEWDTDDIELLSVNEMYRQYDLFRYRCIWIAFENNKNDQPAGVLIAYRGPLGLNFCLLENRMELIINKSIDSSKYLDISAQLINNAMLIYNDDDYPMDFIPLVTPSLSGKKLKESLAFKRKYKKSSWLNKGFEPWCHHVKDFFKDLEKNLQ